MAQRYQCLILLIQRQTHGGRVLKSSTSKGIKGYVLLSRTYQKKYPQVSELFLQNGLQVINDNMEYPSTENITFEVIEILLKDDSSETLTVLCEKHNKETIKPLLRRNSTITFKRQFERDDIRLAVGKGNKQVMKHIISCQADIPYRSSGGGTIVNLAVLNGDAKLVKLLVSCGANIGAAPLCVAVMKQNVQMVEYLLQNGADINAAVVCPVHHTNYIACADHPDVEDGTPLHFALMCPSFSVDIVRLLLERGAPVDAQCEDGRTCLHIAVDSGSLEFVEVVLEHRPDVNNDGNKKSFLAAIVADNSEWDSFYEEMVSKMFEYGFRVGPDDANNYDLLDGAVRKNHIDIVRQLLEYGALDKACNDNSSGQLLNTAARFAKEDMVQLLLDSGVDVNSNNDPLRTPLYHAVSKGKVKTVKLLVERGARIFWDMSNEGNHAQYKLLSVFSVYRSRHEILEMLLKHGADVNATDDNGESVLYRGYRERDALNAVKIILKFGAVVDFTEAGNTPLHKAISEHNPAAFQILLDYCFPDPKLYENLRKNPEYFPDLKTVEGARDILCRHRIKYTCAHSIDDQFQPKILPEFRSNCLDEIEKMKSVKIGSSELFFYDMMFGNEKLITSYAKNDSVVETISQENFKKEFPTYGGVIEWRFWRGYYRSKLVERGIQTCLKLSKQFSTMEGAYILLEKVLSFLNNRELLYLISDRSVISEPLF